MVLTRCLHTIIHVSRHGAFLVFRMQLVSASLKMNNSQSGHSNSASLSWRIMWLCLYLHTGPSSWKLKSFSHLGHSTTLGIRTRLHKNNVMEKVSLNACAKTNPLPSLQRQRPQTIVAAGAQFRLLWQCCMCTKYFI